MKHSRTSLAGLAAVALLFVACSSSGSSPVPVAPSAPSVKTSAPSAAVSAVVAAPSAPTDFTATRKTGVTCPSPDPDGDHCYQDDFAWKASANPGTGFRVYEASFGFDPNGTCAGAQADAQVILDAKPAARSAQLFVPMAVGGGQPCYWITAVNSAGESEQVPAAGN